MTGSRQPSKTRAHPRGRAGRGHAPRTERSAGRPRRARREERVRGRRSEEPGADGGAEARVDQRLHLEIAADRPAASVRIFVVSVTRRAGEPDERSSNRWRSISMKMTSTTRGRRWRARRDRSSVARRPASPSALLLHHHRQRRLCLGASPSFCSSPMTSFTVDCAFSSESDLPTRRTWRIFP